MSSPVGKESSPAAPNWRRLTVRHLWFLLPWVGVVIAALKPIRDNSFLWHVRAGTVQLDGGEVLRADPFSFTAAGEPWRTQSWLAELLYGQLEVWTQLAFVPWMVGLGALATIAFVGAAAHRRTGQALPAALALITVVWVGVGFFAPRPVLISFVFLSATALLLDLPNARWAIPLVIWLWAAVHGSFVLGIGLIVLEGLRTGRRSRLLDAGVATLAASLTAHGLAIWAILYRFVENRGALDFITEWAPPDLLSVSLVPYLLVISGIVIGAACGRIAPRDLWVPLPFLLFGLTSVRATFAALIVALPWAALAWPESWTPSLNRSVTVPRVFIHWVFAAAIVVLPFTLDANTGPSKERFPLTAADYLEEGNVFHDDVTGGYLIYEAWPNVLVYVDDRAELYGEEFFEEFARLRAARPGWEDALRDRGITQALVRNDDPISEVLTRAGWTKRYVDDYFVVLKAEVEITE